MLGPISGLGIRLIWSVMTIRSPTRNEVLMPPEAFDTKRYLMPSLPHDAHRERHLLHAVAFVIVETALHGHDPAALDHAENHTAFVSFDRGDGESRNILVFDGEACLDLIGEAAQTGAEDDAHFGSERVGGGVDESRRFFNFL